MENGAWKEGYTCFRTHSFCNCEDYNASVLITIGDHIKMNVILCPKCAAKKYGKAKPFEKFIKVELEAERSEQ